MIKLERNKSGILCAWDDNENASKKKSRIEKLEGWDFSAYVNGEVVTIDGGEWLQGAGEFNMLEEIQGLAQRCFADFMDIPASYLDVAGFAAQTRAFAVGTGLGV